MNTTLNTLLTHAETQIDRTILDFEQVCYIRAARRILYNITWSLPLAGIGAILGPNGSGKSTLLRIAAGYLWPSSGYCRFNGQRLGTFAIAELRKHVAVVEAAPVLPLSPEMTTLDVVCSGLLGKLTTAYDHISPAQYQRAAWAAELVGLQDHLKQMYETLSTGEKMRAMLARGLVAAPQLLILDECTNGLDIPSRETYLATVDRICQMPDRPAILVVTHYPEELPLTTDRLLLLNSRGEIQAAGRADDVMTTEHFSAAFNWPVTIRRRNGRYISEAHAEGWNLRGSTPETA